MFRKERNYSYSRIALSPDITTSLESPPQGSSGFKTFMKDLPRSITLGTPEKGISGKSIPDHAKSDIDVFLNYLERECKWSKDACAIFKDGVINYSQSPLYASYRLSQLAFLSMDRNYIADTAGKRHQDYLYVHSEGLYLLSIAEGAAIRHSETSEEVCNSQYSIQTKFQLTSEGFQFVEVSLSGEKNPLEIIRNYIQKENERQKAKQQLFELCKDYKSHLRESIRKTWSRRDPVSYKVFHDAYFPFQEVVNDKDFVDCVSQDSGRAKDRASMQLAIEKYQTVRLLESIISSSNKTIKEQLENFALVLSQYRDDIIVQRKKLKQWDVPLNKMLSILSITSSFNPRDVVAGLSKSKGQVVIEKMEAILAAVFEQHTPLLERHLSR